MEIKEKTKIPLNTCIVSCWYISKRPDNLPCHPKTPQTETAIQTGLLAQIRSDGINQQGPINQERHEAKQGCCIAGDTGSIRVEPPIRK